MSSTSPATPELQNLGETGILFADLSGYTQLVYQCTDDETRLRKLGTAIWRLFTDTAQSHPEVRVEGFAGDGFLALSNSDKPARDIYSLSLDLHARFHTDVRALLMDLGFRNKVTLRTGLHVGKVWRMPVLHGPAKHSAINLSDAIVVASRVVTAQTTRRFGLGMTRCCYKRLMLKGGKKVREPDEIIQDRNQYPEPLAVYRMRSEEHAAIASLAHKELPHDLY